MNPNWLSEARVSCLNLCSMTLPELLVNAGDLEKLHDNASNPNSEELAVKWVEFPTDFVFGVPTAATQIKGSAKIQEKDQRISDHSNMFIAIHSFSIPWMRSLPNGTLSGGINQEAIDHYNLIDELIKNGITPYVTISHFDSPQTLQDKYGGPLHHSFVDDFKDYSEMCFKTIGDIFKNWITMNELFIISTFGYVLGFAAPGRCSLHTKFVCTSGNSSTEPYIVSHNLLLACTTVVKLYKEKFQANQGGQIGIRLVEPLVYGDYPKSMRDLVKDRLPSFTNEEKNLVKGSFDFIGINYYTSIYAKTPYRELVSCPFVSKVCRNIDFMKKNYQSPKIYITENGINDAKKDTRIEFKILFGICDGYTTRFGLYYIDSKDNLKRIPKDSAKWPSKFLKGEV
ncbi:hypothetical protein D8674_035153 [Pyrus ussuriensis x Pyrus communis]|uniref:Uncharacterized protein n=1 Tax=Pyrus ussuriensis x Pyrus communis TaxID=2448454 RepID=A0A5N5GCD5_9ROSA|nr:hypothetical protein D8674_035153 [Pyrus ussuriensis x Pyrus communis]